MSDPAPDLPFDLKNKPKDEARIESRGEPAPFTLVPRGTGPFREKYRPVTLSEVIPTCSKDLLQHQIDDTDASHIYMFEGPTGTGKTTCARILAKAMNCLGSTRLKPCLGCQNCKSYPKSFDKTEINSANHNKIENIRNLVVDMRYSPAIYDKKIYILDEVQRITPEAQQVLLAELEDPKSYLRIFLCTTNLSDINPALVDRACKISFSTVKPSDAMEVIRQVSVHEEAEIPKKIQSKLYMESHGSIRALLNNTQAYIQNGFQEEPCESTETNVRKLYEAIISANWRSLSEQLKHPDVRRNTDDLQTGLTSYIRAILLNQNENSDSIRTLYRFLEVLVLPLQGLSSVSKYNSFVMICTKMWAISKKR